jgi:hypothetical protein
MYNTTMEIKAGGTVTIDLNYLLELMEDRKSLREIRDSAEISVRILTTTLHVMNPDDAFKKISTELKCSQIEFWELDREYRKIPTWIRRLFNAKYKHEL